MFIIFSNCKLLLGQPLTFIQDVNTLDFVSD
jgi:hypothetical protein